MAEARVIAYRYLGRREHSLRELKDKLLRRGVPAGVVAETVADLESEGLVSNQRFAESYTRSRISKLFGPLKIRAELMKRGIDSGLVDQVLAQYHDDWTDIAQQWVLKRSRSELDRNEKARLYRSGTSRGFSHEHMMRAFDCIGSGE